MNYLFLIATNEEFEAVMANAARALQLTGLKQQTNSFEWNILALSTFNYQSKSEDTGTLAFLSYGKIATVWDREHSLGVFGSRDGYCSYPSTTSYDYESAQYTFHMANYALESSCESQFIASELGYSKNFDGDNFAFTVDMQTFSIATAINNGIIELSSLELVANLGGNFSMDYDDGSHIGGYYGFYYDSFYAGMFVLKKLYIYAFLIVCCCLVFLRNAADSMVGLQL